MNNATTLYEFTVTRGREGGDGSGVMEGGIGRGGRVRQKRGMRRENRGDKK